MESNTEQTRECARCDNEIQDNNFVDYGASIMCLDCYDEVEEEEEELQECALCGGEIEDGDEYEDDGGQSICYMCSTNYCECYECGTVVHDNNTIYDDGYTDEYYCQECYDELMASRETTCGSCGGTFAQSEIIEDQGYFYCKACHDEEDKCEVCKKNRTYTSIRIRQDQGFELSFTTKNILVCQPCYQSSDWCSRCYRCNLSSGITGQLNLSNMTIEAKDKGKNIYTLRA